MRTLSNTRVRKQSLNLLLVAVLGLSVFSLNSFDSLRIEGPLLFVEKAFHLIVNPGFVIGEAVNLFGWDSGVLREMESVMQ